MRRLAAIGLLAGCNQIFGLDATRAVDASIIDPDAPYLRVTLTYQAAIAATSGAPGPGTLELVPITPAPEVKIGPIGKPLVTVPYQSDGSILVSPSTSGAPWRLEYTPAGDVAHEVQWHPQDNGHLTIPMFGRVAPRALPPPSSSYRITSTPTHNYSQATAFTVGVWSQTPNLGAQIAPVVVATSSFQTMSGAPAAADGAFNDHVLLADFGTGTICSKLMLGCTVAKAAALTAGGITDLSGTFQAGLNGVAISTSKAPTMNLVNALGSRATGQTAARTIAGRIPASGMPAFTTTYDGVPAPMMIVMADCPFGNPSGIDGVSAAVPEFPVAVQFFVSNLRQLSGLSTGFLSSLTSVASGTTTLEPDLRIPLALTAKLGTKDLATGDDGDLVAMPTEPITLEFTHDAFTPDVYFDYFEVLLYSVNRLSSEPTLLRVYLSTNASSPSITIDPSVFKSGIEYVFAIRTHRGARLASGGDFTVHTYPQTVGTIFFRTFTIQ